MATPQSKSKLNIISVFMLIVMVFFAGVMLTSCGKTATTLTIAIEDEQESYNPGDIITFIFSANAKFDSEDVTLVITSGEEYAEIDGQTLKILDGATPGESVVVQAQYGEILSNTLTISISHIEATEINLIAEKTNLYAGEVIMLSATYLPENATRDVEFSIIDGSDIAEIYDDNKLSINEDATVGSMVTVVAKMGDVSSEELTFTVVALEGEVVSVQFAQSNREIDTTISGTTIEIDVEVWVITSESELVSYKTNTATLSVASTEQSVDENSEEIISIINNTKIEVLSAGTATLNLEYEYGSVKLTDSMTITIKMPPDEVRLPENFEDDVNYNYAVNKAIAFALNVDGANGNTDYTMIISGDYSITYTCTADEGWTTTDITKKVIYDGETITFTNTGTYQIYFSSNSGCVEETTSPVLTITVNEGVNVSTKEEFIEAFENEDDEDANRIINLTTDIYFIGGDELLACYGDKSIYGNGFAIDCSGQLTQAERGSSYGTNPFLKFNNVDQTTPYTVIIEDLELIGNVGLFTSEQLAEYKGTTSSYIQEQVEAGNRDYISQSGPYFAIQLYSKYNITEGISGAYAYCIPKINNLTIRGYASGLSLENCIDEVELSGEGQIGVNNLSLYNLLGDGLRIASSQVNIGDCYLGAVGGTPIGVSLDYARYSGVNRDENAYANIIGDIICDNLTALDSLYLVSQVMWESSVSQAVKLFNGVSGMVNSLISLKHEELNETYRSDAEARERINDSLSNFMTTENGSNQYNLFCFTTAGLDNFNFSDENLALMTNMDEEFFLNGIDTTHKFIVLNVYDMLMSINRLGSTLKSIIEQYASTFQKIQVVIINLNYQA